MAGHECDANDPRGVALRSHPLDLSAFQESLTEPLEEGLPELSQERLTLSDFNAEHSLMSIALSATQEVASDEFSDPDDASQSAGVSQQDVLPGLSLQRNENMTALASGGSNDRKTHRNIVRGTSANVRLACTNIEDSQSLDDSKAEVRRHNRERYWKLRLSRRAKDTKEQDEKLSSMDCDGADDKDESPLSEPLRLIMSPQEETEESLSSLINDLVAEDGKEIDPDVLSLRPTEKRSPPANLMDTQPHQGLTDVQVAESRKDYGRNCMTQDKTNHWIKFLMFFMGPIQWVMEATVVLAGGLQDWIDFGIICALLILNAIVGFSQERQAGQIVASLKKTLALRAQVIRNGASMEISAEDVVMGDVIWLEDGDIVAADGKIISEESIIQVDQSSITGESLAVDKHKGDSCYASSAVKRGSGYMIVTEVGDHTFVGTAAALAKEADQCLGHFTRVLNGMARVLLYLVIFTLFAVWISSYYRSDPMVQILEFTLAITVIGVPVGLPVVVTTTMAVGAAYLARRQAIVQNLAAIESLAGVEILCSDKTGTLTRNVLSLGDPYIVPGKTAGELMLTACLAANRNKGGVDAIDKVFLKGLRQYPELKAQIVSYKTLEFFPFDPVSKRVTAIVEALNGERMTCIKGAPKTVLKTVQDDMTLDEQFIADYKAKVLEFANRGFRSLGVARNYEGKNWEILGIMPCLDPPRHDTAQTIAEAKSLGLSIKMLTGDAVGIARETATRLGLGTNIYNAERLGVTGAGSMSGSEVADFVEAADGFAEVYPQHKYSVVEILQARGYLVAMTGDGVNDAPSLKKADTGIAVEGSSDAARSAADIVFLAPGLSAIIDAIKTARQIFHRMYSYVVYRIALSIHLEIYFAFKIFIENRTMDLRLIVLFAIFADIATIAIAYDNATYSQRPVKWNTPRLWGESVVLGILLGLASWLTYGSMLLGENGGIIEGSGSHDEVMFLQISLTQSWLILVTRLSGTGSASVWENRPSMLLLSAVAAVNLTASLMAHFGAFGEPTDGLTIVRVWVMSGGVTCVIGTMYILLHNSPGFDSLMHGRLPGRKARERSSEDFGLSLQRTANQHEANS